jgi:hypothetical protein
MGFAKGSTHPTGWNREQLGIELSPGVDEVSLALVADAWSRGPIAPAP